MTLRKDLASIGEQLRTRFELERRVLSFQEYLDLFAKDPYRYGRDASCYLRDCFDYFGSYEVVRPYGTMRRYRVFDALEQTEGRRDVLVGHERVQDAFYRILSNFAHDHRPNRLTLLHGPNGSAKSTFAACLMRALEHYSLADEGAVYTFSWIFPRGKDGKALGFSLGGAELPQGDSYAHLPEEQIDARLFSELREHPLHVLPVTERRTLLHRAFADAGKSDLRAPDWLWSGELSSKNKKIFEALFTAYRGDLQRVLAHVRVERYTLSRRYRVGAVTIGPQMAVDASERQISADRSLGALPASLSAVTLFEPFGELVDASGGVIEFSDLLKRPLDAWKYLLLAIETNEIALNTANVALNCVMVGSSNELHLAAFKEHPEFNSFRGRFQLVRAPYQRDINLEREIYDSQVTPQIRSKHHAPDTTYVAALWSVLSRLRPSVMERFDDEKLGKVAADLAPLEKADLLSDGRVPSRFSAEEQSLLAGGIEAIYGEFDSMMPYEGLTGASPREMQTLLLDASQHPKYVCFSPLAVLEKIESLVDRAEFDYLREAPNRGFFEHRAFVGTTRRRWLERVDERFRTATGLIEEAQYLELFERYVAHVSYWVKNERVYNQLTGKNEDPDVEMMTSVEAVIAPDADATTYRRNLISSVAAYALDRPGEKLDYSRVFPQHLSKLKEHYFQQKRGELGLRAREMLAVLRGQSIAPEHFERTEEACAAMKSGFGYCDACLSDTMAELVADRYPS